LLFRVRRSGKVTPERLGAAAGRYFRVYGPLTGPSGFGVRALATKSFDVPGELEKSPPCPGCRALPRKCSNCGTRIVKVASDEDKALVWWRGARLEPSSTISNGIRVTMRLIRLLRSLLPESDGRMIRCRFLNEAIAKKDRKALVAVGSRW
jgi:hypothetical protein